MVKKISNTKGILTQDSRVIGQETIPPQKALTQENRALGQENIPPQKVLTQDKRAIGL